MNNQNKDNIGHRKRLKQRFMDNEDRTLPDYEILEMLLFSVYPRTDTKPLAKAMLKEFGSLANIFLADATDMHRMEGINESVFYLAKLMRDLHSRLLLPTEDSNSTNVLNSWQAVVNYLKLTMSFRNTEHFRILYLNRKNVLIKDKIINQGTVDNVSIYPREILKEALAYHASALVIAHNHPSGDPSPSKKDIEITKELQDILQAVNIQLHDHLIVARNKSFSFRGQGLL